MKPALLFSVCLLIANANAAPSTKVIGYFSYRTVKEGFKVTQLPWTTSTHILFSSLNLSDDGKCLMTKDESEDGLKKLFSELKTEKLKYPTVKVMLSVGTLSDAGRFSRNARDAASRAKLVSSCLQIANQYSFDGIDVDWEYPVHAIQAADGRPEDKLNFPLLIKEFRSQLGSNRVLSIATTAYQNHLNDLDIRLLSQSVDWFGIMAYDFCMGASNRTCHHSIFESPKLKSTGRLAIDWYLQNGALKKQIVLGVPFYGFKWKVTSMENYGINQAIIKTASTQDYDGFIEYQEIKKLAPNYGYFWDRKANAPWLTNLRDKTAISFDDERSLQLKSKFIKESGYGGIMVWELPYDSPDHGLWLSIVNALK